MSSPAYKNADDFLQQAHFKCCSHEGLCLLGVCPCAGDKTTCRLLCGCDADCARRFPSCDHDGACTQSCNCVKYRRECIDACVCQHCKNNFTNVRPPRTEIKPSNYKDAGLGLFAGEAISKGTYIGSYHGPIKSQPTPGEPTICSQSHEEEGMSIFRISKGSHSSMTLQ